jgi:hypothetical protein
MVKEKKAILGRISQAQSLLFLYVLQTARMGD